VRAQSEVLDQFQTGLNYGFWFDRDVARWQEFIPTLNQLSAVEMYVEKVGHPGAVMVEIRTTAGAVLAQASVAEAAVPASGWLRVEFGPIFVLPGAKVRIHVRSDAVSPSPGDRYFWRGNTASPYCPECETDLLPDWPDFHYAFRTFGICPISEALDQAQTDENYGYWFEDDVIRWQEFIPSQEWTTAAELRVRKEGNPGNVFVELRTTGGAVLAQAVVAEAEVPALGWIRVEFGPVAVTPGTKYRLYVYSDADSPSPSDRYFWRGSTTSTYCPTCRTDVSGSLPNYDYAFRTFGLASGSEALDQFQMEVNYGYWFEDDVIRWQEFVPVLERVTAVELLIHKEGSPGNVVVEIRTTGGTVLAQDVIAEAAVPTLGWARAEFSPVLVSPGFKYRIYVYSDADSPSPSDRYFWEGSTTSTYCPECETDVSGSLPNYDYAFATFAAYCAGENRLYLPFVVSGFSTAP
jgi:hypothetical protein